MITITRQLLNLRNDMLTIVKDMVYKEMLNDNFRVVDIELTNDHIVMVNIVDSAIYLVAEGKCRMLTLNELSLDDLMEFRCEFGSNTRELKEFTDKVIGFAGTEREIAEHINKVHPQKTPLTDMDINIVKWDRDLQGKLSYKVSVYFKDYHDIAYGFGATFFIADKNEDDTYTIRKFGCLW